jgi:hypothetical protein
MKVAIAGHQDLGDALDWCRTAVADLVDTWSPALKR